MQLSVTGYADRRTLDDAERVRSFTANLAKQIGMTIVNGPTVHSFKESGRPEAGLSAVAIAESHIALHTWPESSYFYLHIGSCKPFDTAAVGAWLRNGLRVRKMLTFKVDSDLIGPPKE